MQRVLPLGNRTAGPFFFLGEWERGGTNEEKKGAAGEGIELEIRGSDDEMRTAQRKQREGRSKAAEQKIEEEKKKFG